jgi:quinol monooxygenase YgiN
MIVFRVDASVHPAKIDQARALFCALTRASRTVPGVISFDILEDPDQPGRFVSIEVYHDQEALDRQGDLPELHAVMDALDSLLTGRPDGTKFHVHTAEAWTTS